jgi:hypothetical protein
MRLAPQLRRDIVLRAADPQTPAVQTLPACRPADLERLVGSFTRSGWYATVVDRAPVFNKATLLHALYQAGRFPAYFGFNWDALADTLSDLGWLGRDGHALAGVALLFNRLTVLEARAPDDHRMLLTILHDVAAARRTAGRPPLRVLAAGHERSA